jgi:hypothetical protein
VAASALFDALVEVLHGVEKGLIVWKFLRFDPVRQRALAHLELRAASRFIGLGQRFLACLPERGEADTAQNVAEPGEPRAVFVMEAFRQPHQLLFLASPLGRMEAALVCVIVHLFPQRDE